MLHDKRRWGISPTGTAEELALKLTCSTWCGCQGFSLAGYLFLNDSTGPDAAQEYAIVKHLPNGRFLQVESVTFSWCVRFEALRYIAGAAAGQFDRGPFVREVRPRVEPMAKHGICNLCA